jgi:hypothetical protein
VRSDIEVDDPNAKDKDASEFAFTFRKVVPTQAGLRDNYCEADINSKALGELLAVVLPAIVTLGVHI